MSILTPLPVPTHLRGQAFRVSEQSRHQLSRSRLRSPQLDRPFHGVRSYGLDLSDLRGRCLAYAVIMRPDLRFSHLTAAGLYGVPLPPGITEGPLHVGLVGPRTPPRARGVVGHRLSLTSSPARSIDGLALSHPAEVWGQVATELDGPDLVAAGDFLLSSHEGAAPLASLENLRAVCAALAGGRGSALRSWALPRLRPGSDLRPLSLLRMLIEKSGLPEPKVVIGESGRPAHLRYQSPAVVIELGNTPVSSRPAADEIRRIRVTEEEFFLAPEGVIDRILRALGRGTPSAKGEDSPKQG